MMVIVFSREDPALISSFQHGSELFDVARHLGFFSWSISIA